MAQQTINVGTSPNDGTGTPLRTAFQYTNSNFSELYTAVGPSGNNIVVPGTATITGDLTVDTSTLKVDSANNRVGIGTASPSQTLQVLGTSGSVADFCGSGVAGQQTLLRVRTATGNASGLLIQGNFTTDEIFINNFYNASLIFGVNNTEQMRLNSTGLGVGGSPSSRLDVANSGTPVVFSMTLTGAQRWQQIIDTSVGNWTLRDQTGSKDVLICTAGAGNVGVGVTPSAWVSGSPAVQLKYNSSIWAYTDNSLHLNQNAYFDGAWKYINSSSLASSNYYQEGGNHRWRTAAAGTAGNAITWATAMTLDASGNLLVGTTSALIASSRRLSVVGTVAAALQSTGAATVETVNVWHTATTGDNIFIDFDTEASVTSRGSISYNRSGGLVAYNTTSDYRAKDIIGPVSNSGSVIDSLKVYIGKMKGASVERPMLVAHEAQTVAPYAVTGEKDAVDVDGNPRYQQMDVSSFVPLLIAEIQSLRARVAALEA